MTENVTQPAKTEEKHKGSFGAKLMVASAFSGIGAKLGLPAAYFDLNNIAGKDLTLKEKTKIVFSWGKFKEKVNERAAYLVKHEGVMPELAQLSLMKHTLIWTTALSIVGFAVGWARGGQFDNWKDVAKHPIKSMAVAFGLKSAEEFCKEIGKDSCPAADMTKTAAQSSSVQSDAAESGKKWTDHVSQRDGHAAAAVQEKAQAATAASIG